MGALKKYGFLIINGVILLVTLVLYFLFVSGRSEDLGKLEDKLERDRKSLVTLSARKPTPQWYDIVEKNIEQVKGGLQSIENGPRMADQKIHRFFDLVNPAEVTDKAPSPNNYQVFKELMVRKWDSLIAAFTGENGPFGLSEKVLTTIEPTWLRSEVPPTHAHQVVDAMKNYWITSELLEMLSENDVSFLSDLTLSGLFRTPSFQQSEKDFWGYRRIEITGRIDLEQVEKLFREFSNPDRMFRVTGFSFSNVMATPPGVHSDASFLRFDERRPQEFKLTLMHFDYLSEGESFEQVAVSAEQTKGRGGRSRVRQRRR